MKGLSVEDLSVIDGDARVSDRRLMEVLGYSAVIRMHELIRRHWGELEDFGEVFSHVREKSQRGRPSQHYYLNEHQATLVCILAQTAKARAARKTVIEVFTSWRRGEALPERSTDIDPFAATAGRVAHVADVLESLNGMDDPAMQVTHLPIWKNGRRPAWWHDIEVRRFLTQSHRQMSLLEAEWQCCKRFGATRSPRRSTIGEYWLRLDRALGPLTHPKRKGLA